MYDPDVNFQGRTYRAALPESTLEGLLAYGKEGRPTGHFLQAVLSNDLFEAVGRADSENIAAIALIVGFIHNELPGGSHGSAERIDHWISDHEGIRSGCNKYWKVQLAEKWHH